jgi:hypothetical protein
MFKYARLVGNTRGGGVAGKSGCAGQSSRVSRWW